MTDRELLEFAAKAAGMTVLPCDEPWPSGAKGWFYNEAGAAGLFYSAGPAPQRWYPLTDDGDALRLAVKLRIGVTHNDPRSNSAYVMADGAVFTKGQIVSITETEDVEDEGGRQYTTRRAIVRAAAEIGKAMP